MPKVLNILHQNRLKATPIRKAVLKTLMGEGKSLSQQDLNQTLQLAFDRSTLFRTLNTFEEKGILHKVLDFQGIARYAFTPEEVEEEHHAHFFCMCCHNIYCLDYSLTAKPISLPEGFKQQSIDLQVKGICANCRRPQSSSLIPTPSVNKNK